MKTSQRSSSLLIFSIEGRTDYGDGRTVEGNKALHALDSRLKALSREELVEEYLKLWPERAGDIE